MGQTIDFHGAHLSVAIVRWKLVMFLHPERHVTSSVLLFLVVVTHLTLEF